MYLDLDGGGNCYISPPFLLDFFFFVYSSATKKLQRRLLCLPPSPETDPPLPFDLIIIINNGLALPEMQGHHSGPLPHLPGLWSSAFCSSFWYGSVDPKGKIEGHNIY